MISELDIAWAAGLFEGEGCFSNQGADRQPTASMNLTDEDVLRRLADLMGGNFNGPYRKGPAHCKPQWNWTISGQRGVRTFYKLVEPYLGTRRRARGLEVLRIHLARKAWRAAQPRYPRICRSSGCTITGPDDEIVIGHKRAQCRACYRKRKNAEAAREMAKRHELKGAA